MLVTLNNEGLMRMILSRTLVVVRPDFISFLVVCSYIFDTIFTDLVPPKGYLLVDLIWDLDVEVL